MGFFDEFADYNILGPTYMQEDLSFVSKWILY